MKVYEGTVESSFYDSKYRSRHPPAAHGKIPNAGLRESDPDGSYGGRE